MEFKIRRVGATLQKPVLSTTWLSDCRLLFLANKPIGRVLVGKFSGQWGGVLYLTITSEPEIIDDQNEINELTPGLYIDVVDSAKVTEDPSVTFHPGIREIYDFLRRIQTKRVRQDREAEWIIRSNTIRKIIEFADNADEGQYEIVAHDRTSHQTRSERPDEDSIRPQVNDKSLVRTSESATGGISVREADLALQNVEKFRHHAFRTREIDTAVLTEKLEKLYQLFGFSAPPVVIFPNPLSTTLAGHFASEFLYNQKHKIDSPDPACRYVNPDLLSKYVRRTVFRSAVWSTQQAMDRTTFDAAVDFLERRFVTNRFADDALRILQNEIPRQINKLAGFEPGFVESDSAIDTNCIRDALDKVLNKKTGLLPKPNNRSPQVRIGDLANNLCAGDSHLEQLLMVFRRLDTDVLLDATIPPVASFGMNVLGLQLPVYKIYAAWENVMLECAGVVLHREFCFVSNFPECVEMDDRNRLHCQTGPAIKWRDGWTTHCWHGASVPKWLIETPDKITIKTINAASNQEFRRIMIEIYGVSRYLIDSGAAEVQRDKFGVLYCQRIDDGEPLTMVRVTNSTPEPDGSVKEYFLRVPPTMQSAEEAVAWTFGLNRDDYNPIVET